MHQVRWMRMAAVVAAALFFSTLIGSGGPPSQAQAPDPVTIPGHISPVLAQATFVGPSDPNRLMTIVVSLKFQNEDALDALIRSQKEDPGSPDYRRLLEHR